MYCPKCGKAEQDANTYCRNCGTFLPDFDKIKRRETPPEEHLKIATVLNLMTAVVSLGLAITLYAIFLGKDDTPVIIYVTAGFLTAMCAWQIQTFIRTLKLKKQFPKRNSRPDDLEGERVLGSKPTGDLLNEADFSDVVPARVSERTTTKLKQNRNKSS